MSWSEQSACAMGSNLGDHYFCYLSLLSSGVLSQGYEILHENFKLKKQKVKRMFQNSAHADGGPPSRVYVHWTFRILRPLAAKY